MNGVLHYPTAYRPTSPTGPPPALRAKLSPRQCEVAILVADGLTNKQIAARLGIADATVRETLRHVRRRLNVDKTRDTRVQITRAVIFAWADAA